MPPHLRDLVAMLKDPLRASGMIAATRDQYPFLEISSVEAVYSLLQEIQKENFLFTNKRTPVRTSWMFCQKMQEAAIAQAPSGAPHVMYHERDFVFVVKLLGLKIRVTNGLLEFPKDNVLNPSDEDFQITDVRVAKMLEFRLTGTEKRKKQEINTIETALSRLLRQYREKELARVFGELYSRKTPIADIKAHLRAMTAPVEIADHQFTRIRQYAVDLGLYVPRKSARVAKRVTLDEDNIKFVHEMMNRSAFTKGENMTVAQVVNRMLRQLRELGSLEAPATPRPPTQRKM